MAPYRWLTIKSSVRNTPHGHTAIRMETGEWSCTGPVAALPGQNGQTLPSPSRPSSGPGTPNLSDDNVDPGSLARKDPVGNKARNTPIPSPLYPAAPPIAPLTTTGPKKSLPQQMIAQVANFEPLP